MVAGWEVDFHFAKARFVVETDGYAFHTDPEKFRRDRIKQNALIRAGYKVLRFTWTDLTEYPERVIADVQHAIRAR